MYIPGHFRERDPALLRAFMRRHSFALLACSGPDGAPQAVHLPLLWREAARDGSQPGFGVLVGHVARANPIWQAFAADDGDGPGAQCLCVFSGPHTYVSPRWYASRPQVPTWNYSAVHAYGRARVVADPQWSMELLEELVATYEQGLHPDGIRPWSISEETQYSARLLPGIVAFELPIERLEGKFKLNQNKSSVDRAGVVAALEASTDAGSRGVADLMRTLPEAAADDEAAT